MFRNWNVEVLPMRCQRRGLRKASIIIAAMLFVLTLMVWVPVSAVDAQERAPGFAGPVTVALPATPTEDATVAALNKEKLVQEVQQLKNQNELDPLGWFRTNASILLSTLVVVIGALIGLWQWRVGRKDTQDKELKDRQAERDRRDEEQKRWLEDRQAEREKRSEERFQSVVEGLGSASTATQLGAAIMLRTFLRPGYKLFYSQSFDLAVAILRLRKVDPDTPEPLDSLTRALITVLKESFPLARDSLMLDPLFLDATGIQLDNAYLARRDLKHARLPEAYLRGANLFEAKISEANLRDAKLRYATLTGADLTGTSLVRADLRKANLMRADLSRADLGGANLSEASLEDAYALKDTNLRGVMGLTKEQLAICKAKGAIIDEDSTTSSSQSTISTPSPS
jgi:hypothetical protein